MWKEEPTQTLERPSKKDGHIREYDQKSGLWYVIYWHIELKCYVSQLAPGQKPVVIVLE